LLTYNFQTNVSVFTYSAVWLCLDDNIRAGW